MTNYNNIEGWFTDLDVFTYSNLIKKIKNKGTLVELGCFKGKSLCSIAEHILKKQINVFAIDTFEGTKNEEAHKGVVKEDVLNSFLKNIKDFKIDKNVTIFEDTTLGAASKFANFKFIDLLFIDADHSTEAVIQDFNTYFPRVKDNGIIAGHDFTWESIRNALEDLNILHSVNKEGNIWWIEKKDLIPNNNVSVVISTKDRYDSLYQTLLCVVNQTHPIKEVVVFDDSIDKVDLRTVFKWRSLFQMFKNRNTNIMVYFTDNGQNINHQRAKDMLLSDYIWRIDDDLIFESTILDLLMTNMKKDYQICAISPLIPTKDIQIKKEYTSGKIEDIKTKGNIQWVDINEFQDSNLIYVDHLHCSFLYKRRVSSNFHLPLSRVGHREETIFTYRITTQKIKRNNKDEYYYGKCAILPTVQCFHLKEPSGGIRNNNENLFHEDENKFTDELNYIEKILKIKNSNVYYLDEGLGDHYVFKKLLMDRPKEILNINRTNDKTYIFCCFPEVFNDIKEQYNLEICSLAEGQFHLKAVHNLDYKDFSIYKYMVYFNWKGSLYDAYLNLYTK